MNEINVMQRGTSLYRRNSRGPEQFGSSANAIHTVNSDVNLAAQANNSSSSNSSSVIHLSSDSFIPIPRIEMSLIVKISMCSIIECFCFE